MRRLKFIGTAGLMFGIAWVSVMGLVATGLWNALMPAIFGFQEISFWQALGLLLLSRVLFGRGSGGGWGQRMRKARFARGWSDLTPDERERFGRAMGRCGGGHVGGGEERV